MNSFVASTSDFWHDPQRKMSFGASVGNIMTEHYDFKNGLCLAVSNTTKQKMIKDGTFADLVANSTSFMDRAQLLFDFSHFLEAKTGENVGHWLDNNHALLGCKPEYLGSHTVDGASNAGE